MDKSCLRRSWQSTNHSWSPSVAETLAGRKVLLAFKDKWSRDSQRFNNSVWVFLKYNIQRNSRRNQTTQQMNISTLWAHICSFSLTAERSDGGQTDANINAKFVILSPRADTGAFTPTSRLCEQVKRWSVELFLFLEMILAGIFQLISIFFKQKRRSSHQVAMRRRYCSQWERPRQETRTVVGTNAGGNNWIFICFTL